jgi:Arylsulfotransferase (ASST)
VKRIRGQTVTPAKAPKPTHPSAPRPTTPALTPPTPTTPPPAGPAPGSGPGLGAASIPVNIQAPSISGDASRGEELTASTGSWEGDTPSFDFEWQSSADGGGWAVIEGASSAAYTPRDADFGRHLRVVVTASNSAGSATAASTATVEALPASTQVKLIPTLFPAFSPGVSDYVTRCSGASPVQVWVAAASGDSVAVDGAPAAAGVHTFAVQLGPGQAFSLDLTSKGASGRYYVRCLPPDFPSFSYSEFSQPSQEGYLTAPSFGADLSDYVIVFNNHGTPIWWDKDTVAPPINATLLPDKTIAWMGYGGNEPNYSFRRLDGTVSGTTGTIGSATDVHELQQDADGNYDLISAPIVGHEDLSSLGGPTDASILDCIAQVVSPSGSPVWSWSAQAHIPAAEFDMPSLNNAKYDLGGGKAVYDLYHCNSLEVTPSTALISFRHLDAVYLIDRASGDIIWKLGGKRRAESLTVNGDHRDVPLDAQHDARLNAEGVLTLHDNGTFWNDGPPRAVSFRVDRVARTATFMAEVTDPTVPFAGCCGSARLVDSGNWLVGWGLSSTFGEYQPDGTPVFRITWSPDFRSSYRTVPVPPGTFKLADIRAGMDAMNPRPAP